MEAADKSKTEGIIETSTAVSDPPKARGVKVAPETVKQRPKWNVGTMAGRAIERASAGRSAPIQTNPDRVIVMQASVKDRTMPRAQEELKTDQALPL